jgi:hypothetical protein
VRIPESSEVSPVNSLVAVAVIVCPTGTAFDGVKAKEPLPVWGPTVTSAFWPMKVLPSSVPEGLEKNCSYSSPVPAL